jgi:hypothetical protein
MALSLMHYKLPDQGLPTVEELLAQNAENAICETACYKCLLSYYNQPDHQEIDRTNGQVLTVLVQLAGAQVLVGSASGRREVQYAELLTLSGSLLEKEWLTFLYTNGFILPDTAQHTIDEVACRPDFAYSDHQLLVFIDGPHHDEPYQAAIDDKKQQQLEEYGFAVVRFTNNKNQWEQVLAQYPDIFGSASSTHGVA